MIENVESVVSRIVCASAGDFATSVGGGDRAAARTVLHHDRLSPPRREPVGELPREDVDAAARRVGDDDPHLADGVGLARSQPRGAGGEERESGEAGEDAAHGFFPAKPAEV